MHKACPLLVRLALGSTHQQGTRHLLAFQAQVVSACSRSASRQAGDTTHSLWRSFGTMVTQLHTKVCIIGSGPAAHTAAIYAGRAELKPLLFEGFLANGIAAGGQLTTTTDVENFPGFPDGILGTELTQRMREQSERCGCHIITETVTSVDLSKRPFHIKSEEHEVTADCVIIATGAVARRLEFKGSGEEQGYWNRGISACAVCDGAAPIFRNKPIAVIGGGDTAMEEANFLTKYGSKVYVIHRRDTLRASKVMQQRAKENPKIEFIWDSEVVEAYGNPAGRLLGGVKVRNIKTNAAVDLEVGGLFFAIGHEPATAFLQGQVKLDEDRYILTKPGSSQTSICGVFAAGDVQDKKWRQAITAAGSGCMAALEAEHFLSGAEVHGVPSAAMTMPVCLPPTQSNAGAALGPAPIAPAAPAGPAPASPMTNGAAHAAAAQSLL